MCVHLTVGPGGLKTSVTVTVRVRSLAHVRAVEFHPSYVSIASACGVTAVHGQFMFLFAAADLGGARPKRHGLPVRLPAGVTRLPAAGVAAPATPRVPCLSGTPSEEATRAGGADPGAAASEAAATGPAGDGGPKNGPFFFGRSKKNGSDQNKIEPLIGPKCSRTC